jgi:leader peptidase (prepilin peptidase)/N-methyltransferase
MQMSLDPLPIAIAFILGSMLGSFYNVLIYRLPRGLSIVFPRSACIKCKSPICWYDNIPVVSYIVLGGRCRRCGERFSFLYPVVEFLSAAAAVLVVWRYGVGYEALWVYLFISILLIITFIDWSHQIIPDVLSLGGVALGWIGSLFCLDVSMPESLLGSLFGAGLLWTIAVVYKVLRKVDGMGGGDVKLMAMIGAFLGWKMVVPVLFIASSFGTLYGLHLMRRGGSGRTAVAFGSFLAPAAALVYAFGARLWALYLAFYKG